MWKKLYAGKQDASRAGMTFNLFFSEAKYEGAC
jgi:hypothetical protein